MLTKSTPSTTGSGARKFVRLTRGEEFALAKFLDEHLTKNGAYVVYKGDMTDEKMAALASKAIPGLKVSHVISVRKALFGGLSPGTHGNSPPMSMLWNAISDPRTRVAHLEDLLTKPKQG